MLVCRSQSSVPLSSQFVVQFANLSQEANVGLDLSALPHHAERFSGAESFLFHQVGHDDGRGPGVAQQAVDKDLMREKND